MRSPKPFAVGRWIPACAGMTEFFIGLSCRNWNERGGALLWTPAFAGVTADGADGVCLFRVLTTCQRQSSLVAKSKLPARQPLQGIFMPQALWNAPLRFWAYSRSRYHPPSPLAGERGWGRGGRPPHTPLSTTLHATAWARSCFQLVLRDVASPLSPPLSRQGGGRNTRVRVLLSGGITHCSLSCTIPQTTPSTGKHLVVYRPTHDFWHWCWGGWFSYYGWRPFQTHLFLCPGGSEGLVGPLAFLHSILQEQTS